MKKTFIVLFIILFNQVFSEDNYIGYWQTPDKKVIIEIKKINKEYKGYVRWLKDLTYPKGDYMEGKEQIDRKNPNFNLRARKIINLQVIGGLKKEKNKLIGGWIYDSWNGRKYYGSAKILNKNTLNLKGSIDRWGIIGYSMKVKRAKF